MISIHRSFRKLVLPTILAAAFPLAGCSDSPTGPEPGPGGGGGGNTADTPPIPVPSAPGGDVPAISTTATRIEKLDGYFQARPSDFYGSWRSEEMECAPGGEFFPTASLEAWASTIQAFSIAGRREYFSYGPLLAQMQLHPTVFQGSDGVAGEQTRAATALVGLCTYTPRFEGAALETPVHVRRDRHWALRPLAGDAGNTLLIYPQTEAVVTTSYESGISRTETEEFGRAITATVGVDLGILSASVSGTLSEMFSSSVTVTETRTETFSEGVTGKPGKVIQFIVWELVETYSFCDAEGNPLTSANYRFSANPLVRRGTAVALQSTEFDLP